MTSLSYLRKLKIQSCNEGQYGRGQDFKEDIFNTENKVIFVLYFDLNVIYKYFFFVLLCGGKINTLSILRQLSSAIKNQLKAPKASF